MLKKFFISGLLLILSMVTCLPVVGAESGKYPVEVSFTGGDPVGESLVYYLREQIRQSYGYRLTSDNETRLAISLITMEMPETKQNVTMYSVAYLIKLPSDNVTLDIHLGHKLGYCGVNRTKSAAEAMVANLDRLVSDFEKMAKQIKPNKSGVSTL